MGTGPFKGFRNQPKGGLPPMPPALAIDRFGKQIEIGHIVLFNSSEDLAFEVVDVKPLMNPNMAPGQRVMQIVLQAQFPVTFLGAQPNRGLVIVGESKARLEAAAARNGSGTTHTVEAESEPEQPSGIVLTDVEKTPPPSIEHAQLAEPVPEFAPVEKPESGKPCGCDPAANHVCERHQAEAQEPPPAAAACVHCGSSPCVCF